MNKGVCILFFTVCSLMICNAKQVVPARGHLNKQDVSVEWIIAGKLFNNAFVVDDQPGNNSALLEANKPESCFKVYPSLKIVGVYNTMAPKYLEWMSTQEQNGRSLTTNGANLSSFDDLNLF